MYAKRAEVSNGELHLRLQELEALLNSPAHERDVKKAEALAMYIARGAASGRIANLAMQLLSATIESRKAPWSSAADRVPQLLSELTAAMGSQDSAAHQHERPQSAAGY